MIMVITDHGQWTVFKGRTKTKRMKKMKRKKNKRIEKWESRPIDDAKAMELIESDVNTLFFRTEEHSSGSPGSPGSKGPRQHR